jgi:hypothetical protein
MRANVFVLAVFIALTNCGGPIQSDSGPSRDPGPFPNDYKSILAQEIKRTYFDPHSLRDVSISTPIAGNLPHTVTGWVVCMEANGKNRMGGYVGLKTYGFLIRNGVVIYSESDMTTGLCRFQSLSPWDLNATAEANGSKNGTASK